MGAIRKISMLVVLAIVLTTAYFAGVITQKYGILKMSHTKYITTAEPLLLNVKGATENFHVLPTGTPMYKDRSLPDGYTRYIVYVNFKGAFARENTAAENTELINPLSAYAMDKDDVSKLMADAPVAKDDLVRMLKAHAVTRAELAEIVGDWGK
jgi:hypothetical protein